MRASTDAFVASSQGLVRSFFARRCASAEDAEDLAQEALCAIVEALPRFRGASAPSTWVWAICRHVLARHFRTAALRARTAAMLETEARAEDEARDDVREELLALKSALEQLGPGDLLLYRCVHERGMSIHEAARLLGRPEGTIKYQLHILRSRMRAILSPEGSKDGAAFRRRESKLDSRP